MTLHVQMPAPSNLFQSANGFASIEHSQAPVSENHCALGSTTYQESAFGLEGQNVNSYLQPAYQKIEVEKTQDYVAVEEDHYHPGRIFDSSTLKESQDTSPWATNSSHWNGYYYQPSSTSHQQDVSANGGYQELADARVYQQYRSQMTMPALYLTQTTMSNYFTMPRSGMVPYSHEAPKDSSGVSAPAKPKPKYYVAHQPIPPEQLSKYSELTPHLEFMRRLEEEEKKEKAMKQAKLAQAASLHIATSLPSLHPSKKVNEEGISPIRTKKRRQGKQRSSPIGESHSRSDGIPTVPLSPELSPENQSDSSTGKTLSSDTATPPPANTKKKQSREPKKPVSQACTFCRERKVPCGRPPSDAEDQTCNQCARRKFVCRYPKPGEKSSRRRHS